MTAQYAITIPEVTQNAMLSVFEHHICYLGIFVTQIHRSVSGWYTAARVVKHTAYTSQNNTSGIRRNLNTNSLTQQAVDTIFYS